MPNAMSRRKAVGKSQKIHGANREMPTQKTAGISVIENPRFFRKAERKIKRASAIEPFLEMPGLWGMP
jgi:hypothetical protein